MTVRDITNAIEEFAPLSVQESWDNSGLVIGSPEDTVTGVMVGFDCTVELIREAIQKGCNMVVTHHPLIFKGVTSINPKDPVGAAIIAAVKGGVAVYAAHTSADKVIKGVSGDMALRLGLVNVEILEPDGEGTGLGCIGDLPKPLSAQEALKAVKEAFGLEIIRYSRPVACPIRRVAVFGGSGGSDTEAAFTSGAQLFVTAEVGYHKFFTPEGFMVMDIGHFESEVGIVDIFLSEIRKKFPNFANFSSAMLKESNPVLYYR